MIRSRALRLCLMMFGWAMGIAQSPVWADGFLNQVGGQQATSQIPEKLPGLLAEVAVTGPVRVPSGVELKWIRYSRYLVKMETWERKGCELSRQRRAQADAGTLVGKPLYFRSSRIGRHSFSDEILAQLPPRPRSVARPQATEIPLCIRVTNASAGPIWFNDALDSDAAACQLHIEGKGAFEIRFDESETDAAIRRGNPIRLAPGKSIAIRQRHTRFGVHGKAGYWLLTRPGNYRLSVTIRPGLLYGRFATIRSSAVVFVARSKGMSKE